MPISLPISSSCIYLSFHIYVIKAGCFACMRRGSADAGGISLSKRHRTAKLAGSGHACVKRNGGRLARVAEALGQPSPALLVTRDYLRLVQAFAQLEDRDLRRTIIALVERLAARSADFARAK